MAIGRNTLTAFLAMIAMIIILGVAYPLVITGLSQLFFPGNANGQLVKMHGRVVGSKIVAQPFATYVHGANGKVKLDSDGNPVLQPDPKYFQPRPSATSPAYNAAGSSFSNLGPNNKTTEQEIAGDVQQYLALNKPYDPSLTAATVPVDAANASGSGLDPGISQANAAIQARRIVAVRHIPLATVMKLISGNTMPRSLAIWGEPSVNVLELNLALDRMQGAR